jgi:hypothetical protein
MSTATKLLLELLEHVEYDPGDAIGKRVRAFIATEKEAEPTGYAQKVIEALYENGDPVSIDAAELLERLTENTEKEAEPVAWWFVYSDGSVADGQSYESKDDCVEAWSHEIESGFGKPEPFFRRQPKPSLPRKPMTHEEIVALFESENPDTYFADFRDSIRYAEKHHEIGGE